MDSRVSNNKMYVCEKCNYKTNRKSSFTSHLNRKKPCDGTHVQQNVDPVQQNVDPVYQNVTPVYQNVTPVQQNVTPDTICDKCGKNLCSKQSLNRHLSICTGIKPLQCPRCLMTFESRNGKYKHVHRNKCTDNQQLTVINNNNNNNTNNNITNNNVSNNFMINFDNYTHDHINHIKFMDDCRNAISSVSVVEQYVKHTFHDPKHPENNSVRLTNLRPDYKFMDVYRGKWVKDLQSTIMRKIVGNSFKFTRDVLKNEDPNYNVDIYDDLEESDNLKLYEKKMILDKPEFKKDVHQTIKKTIYNHSVT
jgi:hypothetical protein